MKYINAAIMILSLLGSFAVTLLGFDYEYVSGYGLHPANTGFIAGTLLAIGYAAAHLIDNDQDE